MMNVSDAGTGLRRPRLPEYLARMPIKRKLTLIVLAISGLSLSVGFAIVTALESRGIRETLVDQTLLVARVVGDYCVSALAFGDRQAAADSLSKLEAVPTIDAALLYDVSGTLLASYGQVPGGGRPPEELSSPYVFSADRLLVDQPIELDGEAYGRIRLWVSTRDLDATLNRNMFLMASLAVLLIALSALAAVSLQGLISAPIVKLAAIAKRVSREGDYSIRAPVPEAGAEIADLFTAWNEMLGQIESRSQKNELYQAALELNESRFRGIIESSRNAIFVLLGTRLVFANPQFLEIFGYPQEELSDPQFDYAKLVGDGSPPLYPRPDEIRDGVLLRSLNREVEARLKDGSLLDFELVLSSIEWDGEPATMGVLHNITERKLAEMEREQDLLRQSNLKLERYARALESSNQQLEQFAYVASHDLQEPLRTVASYVQLLARRYSEQLDADADDFIGFAVDGAKRMQALIEDLLRFSRINAERPLEETDCDQILARVTASLRTMIEESGATLEIDPLPVIEADSTQLLQLFQNLINNAVKFRRDVAPVVRISAQRGEEAWTFAVEDNGLGIESEYHDRIFTIFQRLHNRERYPGTGIGLALCRKIVERHHGRIWVESEIGTGSTFYFTIPVDQDRPLDPGVS